jgi:hypothetical protein
MDQDTKRKIKNYMANLKRQKSTVHRTFPKGICCSSTNEYVHAYYRMNNLLPHSQVQGVRDLFEPLSTNPTTWPEPENESELEQLIEAAKAMGKIEVIHVS